MTLYHQFLHLLPFLSFENLLGQTFLGMALATTSIAKKVRRGRTFGPYKGVQMRTWGKWVSEMRVPKSGERIWLGSYDAPEKAVKAYDAAQYCIHGDRGSFNFPADKRPVLCQGSMVSLSKKDMVYRKLQQILHHLNLMYKLRVLFWSRLQLPQVSLDNNSAPPNMLASRDMDGAYESIGDSFAPRSVIGATASPESLELDDFLLLDTEWIDALI